MSKLSPERINKNMAAIRSKDTKPEMIVRRGLWKRGFRYRLNHKRLPGHPDLVLRKYRTCIFVNGCFWHGQLESIAFTLNHIWLQDHSSCKTDDVRGKMYPQEEEEDMQLPIAAEELTVQD